MHNQDLLYYGYNFLKAIVIFSLLIKGMQWAGKMIMERGAFQKWRAGSKMTVIGKVGFSIGLLFPFAAVMNIVGNSLTKDSVLASLGLFALGIIPCSACYFGARKPVKQNKTASIVPPDDPGKESHVNT